MVSYWTLLALFRVHWLTAAVTLYYTHVQLPFWKLSSRWTWLCQFPPLFSILPLFVLLGKPSHKRHAVPMSTHCCSTDSAAATYWITLTYSQIPILFSGSRDVPPTLSLSPGRAHQYMVPWPRLNTAQNSTSVILSVFVGSWLYPAHTQTCYTCNCNNGRVCVLHACDAAYG